MIRQLPKFRVYSLVSDELTIVPSEQGRDKLQNLELLRICPIKSQKVKEVVCD